MKKLLAGVIAASLLTLTGVGCDSKTTTKTTETKENPTGASTAVKEKP